MLHLVFRDTELRAIRHGAGSESALVLKAHEVTKNVFSEVATYMEQHHQQEYLAAFSKSSARCEELVSALRPPKEIGRTPDMFPAQ